MWPFKSKSPRALSKVDILRDTNRALKLELSKQSSMLTSYLEQEQCRLNAARKKIEELEASIAELTPPEAGKVFHGKGAYLVFIGSDRSNVRKIQVHATIKTVDEFDATLGKTSVLVHYTITPSDPTAGISGATSTWAPLTSLQFLAKAPE